MAYAMVATEAGSSKVLKKENIEVPKPKKGEVLIRQTAIGINYIDVYQRSGVYPPPGGEFPVILGSEGAGVVQGVG
ncbi:MAG: alcohol dehydrogenase catalytic domain-containing protein, partial [Salaquimonas sp.]